MLVDGIIVHSKFNKRESKRKYKGVSAKSFKKAAESSSNVKQYQFWRHDNKPIELWSNAVIKEKVDYIHQNPVEAGIVEEPEHYMFISTRDYIGKKGLLEVEFIE